MNDGGFFQPFVEIKTEDPMELSTVTHISERTDQSDFSDMESNFGGSVSGVSLFTTASYATIQSFQSQQPKVYLESKEPKKEEKPVVHRKTGIIGVQSILRRRLLAQSLIRLPTTLLDSAFGDIPAEHNISIRSASVDSISMQTDAPVPQNNGTPNNDISHSNENEANVSRPLLIIEPVENSFCGVCNQFYKNRTTLRTHFGSQKHRNNLNKVDK